MPRFQEFTQYTVGGRQLTPTHITSLQCLMMVSRFSWTRSSGSFLEGLCDHPSETDSCNSKSDQMGKHCGCSTRYFELVPQSHTKHIWNHPLRCDRRPHRGQPRGSTPAAEARTVVHLSVRSYVRLLQ